MSGSAVPGSSRSLAAAWHYRKNKRRQPPDHGCVVGQSKRDALAETPLYDDIKKATFSDWAIVGRGDLAVASNNIEIEPKSGGAPLKPDIPSVEIDGR
jgi:hypothetical protein